MDKSRIWIAVAILILLIAITAGIIYFNYNSDSRVIGGDKDQHGCLIGAGYSWCESRQKCLRPFEESCAESFCLSEDVQAVYQCREYVKVVSSLLGGGETYYSNNLSQIKCPVVSPDFVSEECIELSKLNCVEIAC